MDDRARLYDLFYGFKDYRTEAVRLEELIAEFAREPAGRLLDVACGTGQHLARLSRKRQVEGLDIDLGLLAAARERNPTVTFHQGDMASFDLGQSFAVVTCLFGSIGYVMTAARLASTCATVARHLEPGGIFILEPWLRPDVFRDGIPAVSFVDKPHVKGARVVVPVRDGTTSILEFHFLLATEVGVERSVERHELCLFLDDEYEAALAGAGFELRRDRVGLTGRGLYIGLKS